MRRSRWVLLSAVVLVGLVGAPGLAGAAGQYPTSTPTPTGKPQYAPQSRQDGPAQVVKEVSYILVTAYVYGKTAVGVYDLQHVYACRDSSCGYQQAVADLGQQVLTEKPSGPRSR